MGWSSRAIVRPGQLVSQNFVHSDWVVKFSLNPGQGKGGTCFGDSGGPDLVAGTDTVIAVNSYVTNGNCTGVGYSSRIDRADTLSSDRQLPQLTFSSRTAERKAGPGGPAFHVAGVAPFGDGGRLDPGRLVAPAQCPPIGRQPDRGVDERRARVVATGRSRPVIQSRYQGAQVRAPTVVVLRVRPPERRFVRWSRRRERPGVMQRRQLDLGQAEPAIHRLDLVQPLVDVALRGIGVGRQRRQWSDEIDEKPAPNVASDGPSVQPQPHCGTSGSPGHSANTESYAAPVSATSASSGRTSRGPTHHRPPPLDDSEPSGRRTSMTSNGSRVADPALQSGTVAGSVPARHHRRPFVAGHDPPRPAPRQPRSEPRIEHRIDERECPPGLGHRARVAPASIGRWTAATSDT